MQRKLWLSYFKSQSLCGLGLAFFTSNSVVGLTVLSLSSREDLHEIIVGITNLFVVSISTAFYYNWPSRRRVFERQTHVVVTY